MQIFTTLFFSLLAFTATCQISFNTGNSDFDADLNSINVSASANFGSFRASLSTSYNVSEKEIDHMHNDLKMEPGEIYLALEISKTSKQSVNQVIDIYQKDKGKGWGHVAQQAGIKPGSQEFQQMKTNANDRKQNGNGNSNSKGNGNGKKGH